jgi:hypothetical protein
MQSILANILLSSSCIRVAVRAMGDIAFAADKEIVDADEICAALLTVDAKEVGAVRGLSPALASGGCRMCCGSWRRRDDRG